MRSGEPSWESQKGSLGNLPSAVQCVLTQIASSHCWFLANSWQYQVAVLAAAYPKTARMWKEWSKLHCMWVSSPEVQMAQTMQPSTKQGESWRKFSLWRRRPLKGTERGAACSRDWTRMHWFFHEMNGHEQRCFLNPSVRILMNST